MKIAVIGWSGNKNEGDERMYFCLKKFFAKEQLVPFSGWLPAIENINKVNACDYVIIGGGGLIVRGFNRYVNFLSSIKKPLGCVGISIEVDKLNQDMIEGLELLKKKSEFIYVRDKKSKKLLGDHYKVITGPDISFLYPYPQSEKEVKEEICALNLRNWVWWDFELFGYWHELFTKIEKKIPWFKSVYLLKKWEPDKLVKILKKIFSKILPFPLYFGSYDKTDVDILAKYFNNVEKKFNLQILLKSRYLVGMRLHSLIFSCQVGIPFVSLSYEPKNVNFCREIGLPELSLELKNYQSIPKKIKFIRENYQYIRKRLLNYRFIANKECRYIFNRIKNLIKSTSK